MSLFGHPTYIANPGDCTCGNAPGNHKPHCLALQPPDPISISRREAEGALKLAADAPQLKRMIERWLKPVQP